MEGLHGGRQARACMVASNAHDVMLRILDAWMLRIRLWPIDWHHGCKLSATEELRERPVATCVSLECVPCCIREQLACRLPTIGPVSSLRGAHARPHARTHARERIHAITLPR